MEKIMVAGSPTRSLSPSGYFSCVVCSEDTEEQGPIINFCGHVFCWPCLYNCVTLGDTCRRLRGTCPICECGIDLCPEIKTVCRTYHIAGAQSHNSFTSRAEMIFAESNDNNRRGIIHIDKPRDKRICRMANFVTGSIWQVSSACDEFEERMRRFLFNWRSAETRLKKIVQDIQMTAGNLKEELSQSGGAPVDAFYNEITELVDGLRHEILHCQKDVFDTILEVRQTWIDLHTSLTSHHPPYQELTSLPNQTPKFKEEDSAATSEVRIQCFLEDDISACLSRSQLSHMVCNKSTLDEHVHTFSGYPLGQPKPSESTNKENSTKVHPNKVLDSSKEDISRMMHRTEALMDEFKTVVNENRWQLYSFSDFIEEKTRLFLMVLEGGSYLRIPTSRKGLLKPDIINRWINHPPKSWCEVLDVDAILS